MQLRMELRVKNTNHFLMFKGVHCINSKKTNKTAFTICNSFPQACLPLRYNASLLCHSSHIVA